MTFNHHSMSIAAHAVYRSFFSDDLTKTLTKTGNLMKTSTCLPKKLETFCLDKPENWKEKIPHLKLKQWTTQNFLIKIRNQLQWYNLTIFKQYLNKSVNFQRKFVSNVLLILIKSSCSSAKNLEDTIISLKYISDVSWPIKPIIVKANQIGAFTYGGGVLALLSYT